MSSKIARNVLTMILLAGALAANGCSEAKSSEKYSIKRSTVNGLPSVVATQQMSGHVKIEAIDYDNRSIALEGFDGKSAIFKVPAAVRNFEQIKKGDIVNVDYLQTIDVNLRKVSEPPSAAGVSGIAAAPLGEKPGVVAFRTVEVLANVQAIDHKARTVTLVGLHDKPVTIQVSPELKNFEKVAQGDQVVFTYNETISINVTE
jgi:hypothetical protein